LRGETVAAINVQGNAKARGNAANDEASVLARRT
jgi:hypothetical protein